MVESLISASPEPLFAASINAGGWTWVLSILEPAVVGYGLWLYRRMGIKRVGWLLFSVFLLLALGHFSEDWRSGPGIPTWLGTIHVSTVLVPLLLLIGMSHTVSVWSQEARWERKQQVQARTQERASDEEQVRALAELTSERDRLLAGLAAFEAREKGIEEGAEYYRMLFRENPQPMWILELGTFRFLSANRAALDRMGYGSEEFAICTARDILSSEDFAAFVQDSGRPARVPEQRGVWRFRRKDGTFAELEVTVVDLEYNASRTRLVVAADVAVRREREHDAWQDQRLEMIGRVAGAMANHFKDILGTVSDQATTCLEQAYKHPDGLNQILAAAEKGRTIVQQLLRAGSAQPGETRSLDVDALIAREKAKLGLLLGQSIHLEVHADAALSRVEADPSLIEHILLELLLNARLAMVQGGTARISTSVVRFSSRQPTTGEQGEEKVFLCLTIRDTGCGMSREVLEKLYEPFLSGWAGSAGLGLGLASVHGVVKQLSGAMEITSASGQGTEVKILLPCRVEEEIAPEPTASEVTKATPRTVLLVDAEERSRSMARAVLNWNGYRVIETDSAALALALCKQVSRVDLLLTDDALPGEVSGADLATRLRAGNPEMKVLYTSLRSASHPAQEVLQKPYRSMELLKRVNECLSTDANSAK